jgi:hypothetical protein
MATNSPPPFKSVHIDDRACDWLITLETIDDPLALARVLEKLAVPAVEIRAVNYIRGAEQGLLTLRVHGSEAWLQLLTRKLAKLVAARNVRLRGMA